VASFHTAFRVTPIDRSKTALDEREVTQNRRSHGSVISLSDWSLVRAGAGFNRDRTATFWPPSPRKTSKVHYMRGSELSCLVGHVTRPAIVAGSVPAGGQLSTPNFR
jgi:hypothetical protein